MPCHLQLTSGVLRYFAPGHEYPEPPLLTCHVTYDGEKATVQGLASDKFTVRIGREIIRFLKSEGYRRIRWERKNEAGEHLRWAEF